MHLIIGTRGEYKSVQSFIDELRTRYVSFRRYNEVKKSMEDLMIGMRVCPIQFWDISFPTEHTDAVLNTVLQGSQGQGVVANKHLQKYMNLVRWGLKLDKIPEYKKDLKLSMMMPQNTEVVAIGMKKDKWRTEDGRLVNEEDKTPLSMESI